MAKVEPFDDYPGRYENWFERNKFAFESELLAVKSQLPENGEGIEIGVGSGRFAQFLGIKVGIEPSKKMREIAQKRGIEVIDGIAEDLPFNDLQFDFALMVTTICFLDDIDVALKEAYRVIKPRGVIICGLIDKNSPLGMLYQQHKEYHVFYKAATFYSLVEVVHHLTNTGFTSFSFTQTIFHSLAEIKTVEPIKEGHGEGAFVVVRGEK